MAGDDEGRTPFAPLADALRDVRAAGERLREEQQAAWRRYLADVDRALQADLQVDETGDTPADDPVQAVLDAARGRLDDLRVQARLGLMEGEDLLEELRAVLGDVVARVRPPAR